MIAILDASYPSHVFKQVVAEYTSPDIPKRSESWKEVGSLGYIEGDKGHAVFMFDVPDNEVGHFMLTQAKRTAFIGGRVAGFSSVVRVGQAVSLTIQTLMPLQP
jgi:hypothetical protein